MYKVPCIWYLVKKQTLTVHPALFALNEQPKWIVALHTVGQSLLTQTSSPENAYAWNFHLKLSVNVFQFFSVEQYQLSSDNATLSSQGEALSATAGLSTYNSGLYFRLLFVIEVAIPNDDAVLQSLTKAALDEEEADRTAAVQEVVTVLSGDIEGSVLESLKSEVDTLVEELRLEVAVGVEHDQEREVEQALQVCSLMILRGVHTNHDCNNSKCQCSNLSHRGELGTQACVFA